MWPQRKRLKPEYRLSGMTRLAATPGQTNKNTEANANTISKYRSPLGCLAKVQLFSRTGIGTRNSLGLQRNSEPLRSLSLIKETLGRGLNRVQMLMVGFESQRAAGRVSSAVTTKPRLPGSESCCVTNTKRLRISGNKNSQKKQFAWRKKKTIR